MLSHMPRPRRVGRRAVPSSRPHPCPEVYLVEAEGSREQGVGQAQVQRQNTLGPGVLSQGGGKVYQGVSEGGSKGGLCYDQRRCQRRDAGRYLCGQRLRRRRAADNVNADPESHCDRHVADSDPDSDRNVDPDRVGHTSDGNTNQDADCNGQRDAPDIDCDPNRDYYPDRNRDGYGDALDRDRNPDHDRNPKRDDKPNRDYNPDRNPNRNRDAPDRDTDSDPDCDRDTGDPDPGALV